MTRIRRGLAIATIAAAGLLGHNSAAEAAQKVMASPQAQEFLRTAREELAAGEECREATKYLRGLPVKQRLQVARAILHDPDARIGYLGAGVLIEQGLAQQAVPALAAIIASGRNETQLNGRMGYDWIHADDQTLFLRMAVSINRYLLTHLSEYTAKTALM